MQPASKSPDQNMAAGCILSSTPGSKVGIPVECAGAVGLLI
jgi:hypothetical protein